MPQTPRPRFGIMTAPSQVDYHDVLRVWREADTIPEIEHAWLFDHLMPIGGDPGGPAYEGWTLLSALAAQTQRLRLGLSRLILWPYDDQAAEQYGRIIAERYSAR